MRDSARERHNGSATGTKTYQCGDTLACTLAWTLAARGACHAITNAWLTLSSGPQNESLCDAGASVPVVYASGP